MASAYEILGNRLQAKPMSWLITGVAGFIGSHLLEELLKLNQHVTGIDNFITGSRKNLLEVESLVDEEQWRRFKFIEGDIRSLDQCVKAMAGVDYVLHQAALGSVPRSLADPITTNDHNINAFLNMLVAAKDSGIKRLVYAASSSTYGDHPGLPKVENIIGRPLSPYAVTKVVNELYADTFYRCYRLDTIGLRYFNVFGPRQNPAGPYAAVIPLWFTSLLEDREVFINGDGKTSRDFCFITNAVEANLLAACAENPDAKNQVFNIAFSNETTLNQLYSGIRKRVAVIKPNATSTEPIYREFRAGDVRHSLADISKARTLLNYEPRFSVNDGLDLTSAWFERTPLRSE
ncbi:MAG: NAD-dependent epimerase/dehydratase family protein [Thermoleophilia bacterium]